VVDSAKIVSYSLGDLILEFDKKSTQLTFVEAGRVRVLHKSMDDTLDVESEPDSNAETDNLDVDSPPQSPGSSLAQPLTPTGARLSWDTGDEDSQEAEETRSPVVETRRRNSRRGSRVTDRVRASIRMMSSKDEAFARMTPEERMWSVAEAACDRAGRRRGSMKDLSTSMGQNLDAGIVVDAPVYFNDPSLWFKNVPQDLRVTSESFCEAIVLDTEFIGKVADSNPSVRRRYGAFREAVIEGYKEQAADAQEVNGSGYSRSGSRAGTLQAAISRSVSRESVGGLTP
jgi:hypothetical protein